MDHPDIAYLDRYAHVCCSPFGAAEQRSRWWNKTPNLSERQRVFGVPATSEQPREARRAGIVGCLFLDTSFGQAKEVCHAASKGNLMDNGMMIIALSYSLTGGAYKNQSLNA
jgi:hypothetical protein